MQSTHSTPILPNGHSAVPQGHIAAVVTCLEMLGRPQLRPARPFSKGLKLQPLDRPTNTGAYRKLILAVGADWLWFSRIIMAEEKLNAILDDPRVEVFALRQSDRDVGILELDFREPEACELVYFGLTSDMVGQGLGRTLMNEAINRAWSRPIKRFWVHTCTLDHPAALDFYRRSGFTPYAFQVEVARDPRLTGAMPRNCAPHVPLLG